jgi:signal peptidase I
MRPYYFFIIPSTVLGALAFGYAIATTGITPKSYSIPSGSMIPTLEVGEMIFASHNYYRRHAPVPGDVVLFHMPWHGELTTFIKRVVAGPGDRVKMEAGRLVLNGATAARAVLPPLVPDATMQRYRETLPNGRSYEIFEASDSAALDQTAEIVLGPEHYFVMGDNRDHSNDSRNPEFGPIALTFIDDRASIIWLSQDWRRIGRTLQPEQ